MSDRLGKDFFCRDVLEVCPDLIGKNIVRSFGGGRVERFTITEVEAYQGTADLGCHAGKGRTPRTEIMFHGGAHVYVYLIYGMYWMLNFVTGTEGEPSSPCKGRLWAVMVRQSGAFVAGWINLFMVRI